MNGHEWGNSFLPIHTATTHTGCCHPPSWLLPPWQAGPKHSGRFASLPAVEHHRPCSASPVLQALLWPTRRLAFLPQADQAVSPIATHCLPVHLLSVCFICCCLSVFVCLCLSLSVSVCLSNLVKARPSLWTFLLSLDDSEYFPTFPQSCWFRSWSLSDVQCTAWLGVEKDYWPGWTRLPTRLNVATVRTESSLTALAHSYGKFSDCARSQRNWSKTIARTCVGGPWILCISSKRRRAKMTETIGPALYIYHISFTERSLPLVTWHLGIGCTNWMWTNWQQKVALDFWYCILLRTTNFLDLQNDLALWETPTAYPPRWRSRQEWNNRRPTLLERDWLIYRWSDLRSVRYCFILLTQCKLPFPFSYPV